MPSRSPRLSIVVPLYNVEHYIAEAIRLFEKGTTP